MRYLPFAVVVIAMIYTLVDCVRSEPATVRAMPRVAWIFVILLLPVVGVVLWFLFGRPQSETQPAAPAPRVVAPDDDPRFLHDLEERRRRERAAERRAQQTRTSQSPVQGAAGTPPVAHPTSGAETDRAEDAGPGSTRAGEPRSGEADGASDTRSGRTPRDPAQDQNGGDEATGA